MATVLDNFDFVKKGRPSKYPWDEWLDGATRKIVVGEDFECKADSMASQIRNKANELDLSTHLILDEEEGSIIFQAFQKPVVDVTDVESDEWESPTED